MNKTVSCTGEVRVSLPIEHAIEMFTPEGERVWAPGWDPHYPAGQPKGRPVGTVWITEVSGRETTWTVVDSEERAVRYARVTPGIWAGTVSVRCRPDGDAESVATVTYDITALSQEGEAELERLAAAYPEHMAEWERLIDEAVAAHA